MPSSPQDPPTAQELERDFTRVRSALRWNLLFTVFLMAVVIFLDPPYAIAIAIVLAVVEFGSYPPIVRMLRANCDRKIAALSEPDGQASGTVYPDVGV